MSGARTPLSQRAVATWLAGVATALAVAAAAGVAAAALLPVRVEAGANAAVARRVPAMPPPPEDVRPLMAKAAGRHLVMPAQGLAPVKDTGAAAKLLERLKLQGVVQLGGEYVAYVAVKSGAEATKSRRGGGGSLTVRKDDRVLGFTVKEVAPGKVTLDLDNVIVELRQ
jgi:hypothetical protein